MEDDQIDPEELREDLVSERTASLLRAAASRAEKEMYPVDGNFLREHQVTSAECLDLMDTLMLVLRGFANGGKHLQTAIFMSALIGDEIGPDPIIQAMLLNYNRDRLEQLRERFQDLCEDSSDQTT